MSKNIKTNRRYRKLFPTNFQSLLEVYGWLEKNDLIMSGSSYEAEFQKNNFSNYFDFNPLVLAIPSNRTQKKSKAEIEQIIKEKQALFSKPFDSIKDKEFFFKELQMIKQKVRLLNINRLSPDAMAFYRPFHISPFDQWGIYLFVDKIINYSNHLINILSHFRLFTKELLTCYVLFEIFHHEFFHHIVESTATTIEIIFNATTNSYRKIYLDHFLSNYGDGINRHPHHPLEEALANAYAFNSFSFISNVSNKPTLYEFVTLYQELIKHYWQSEPPGYRYAENYIKGGQIIGAGELLHYLFNNVNNDVPLNILAQRVFPSGHTAFIAKPDIPVYLVGKDKEIELLYDLVPAPNEAYTNLFWPGKTEELDNYIRKRKEQEKEKERKRKAALKNRQSSLFP